MSRLRVVVEEAPEMEAACVPDTMARLGELCPVILLYPLSRLRPIACLLKIVSYLDY